MKVCTIQRDFLNRDVLHRTPPGIRTIPRRARRPRCSEREAKGKPKVSGCQPNNSSRGSFSPKSKPWIGAGFKFHLLQGLSADRQTVRRNAEGSVPYGRWYKKAIWRKLVDSFETFCIVRRSESAQSLVGNAAPGVPFRKDTIHPLSICSDCFQCILLS